MLVPVLASCFPKQFFLDAACIPSWCLSVGQVLVFHGLQPVWELVPKVRILQSAVCLAYQSIIGAAGIGIMAVIPGIRAMAGPCARVEH